MNGINRFWCCVAICCVVGAMPALAQTGTLLHGQDSVAYEQAKDTIALLQTLSTKHHGEMLGLKAQSRLGFLYYQAGNDSSAAKQYDAVYQQSLNSPESVDAAYHLGKINLHRKNYAHAKRFLKESADNSTDAETAEWSRYLLVRSMIAANDMEVPSAVSQYFSSARSVSTAKEHVLQHDVVNYYAGRKNFTQAVAEAKKLVAQYPNSKYVHEVEPKIVDYELVQGHIPAAISYCKQMLKKYKNNTDDAARAQNMLAILYADSGMYDQARIELRKVSAKHPAAIARVHAAEYMLAVVDLQEGNAKSDSTLTKSALKNFQTFAKAYPGDHHTPMAWMNAADINMQMGKTNDAYAAYSNVLAFDTVRLSQEKGLRSINQLKEYRSLALKARLAKGKAMMTKKSDYAQGVIEFDAVLAKEPGNAEAKLNKARCLVGLGRKQDAKTILQELADGSSKVQQAAKTMLTTIR
jgi:tetratricopeptide (TPR) repeat protein